MRKIKYILSTLTLTVAFTAVPTVVSEACSYHLSWDLVDSNKKIDWDGSTVYSTAWDHAVTTWNNMGAVKIQPDSWNVIEDANIADYNDSSDDAFAYTSSNGNIRFNRYWMDDFTAAQKKKTVTHELGHALGIDHIQITGNIMKQGKISQTSLGDLDKSTYNCIWN